MNKIGQMENILKIKDYSIIGTLFKFIFNFIGEKVAIKAMQKSRITDYESFQNEISILRSLVSIFLIYSLID